MANIKKYTRDVLSDSAITNLTADKKVCFLHATNPVPPYVEYQMYDENGEDWAENKEIATDYFVQVDIFSKTDYTALEDKIREKMLAAGFVRGMAADLYEPDTGLCHKAMRFVITLI